MAGGNSRQQIEEALGLKDANELLLRMAQNLNPILDSFKNIATESKNISTNLGGKNSLKEIVSMAKLAAQQAKAYADEQKALLDVGNKLIEQQNKEAKARKAVADAMAAEERSKQSALKTEQMSNKAKETSNKLTGEAARIAKLQEQVNNSLAGSYNKLNAQYQLNVIELNKMSNEQRENTEAGKMLTKQTAELYAQLGKLDESTGRHQRSVGNYAKAFNGLQFQMQQIAREAPSLAYGPQMFIAAISNNLPMLQDEIAKTRIENERLKASGEKAVPVWKQMAMGLLSWQTAAVVLVTTYMLFSKEINAAIASLFKGRQALNETKIVTENLTAAKLDGVKAAQDELTTLRLLYNASQDETLSKKERLAAIDEMQKTYPSYLGNLSDEEILAGKAQRTYYELANAIMAAAMAQARRDKISENSKKILEFEEQLAKAQEAQFVGLTKVEQAEKKRTSAFSLRSFIAKQGEIYGSSAAFKAYSDAARDAQDNIAALVKANEELAKGIKPTDLLFDPNPKDKKGNEYTALEQMQDLHKQELAEAERYGDELLANDQLTEAQILQGRADNARELIRIRLEQIEEEKKIKGLTAEQIASLENESAKKQAELQKVSTNFAVSEEKRLTKEMIEEEKERFRKLKESSSIALDITREQVDSEILTLQEAAIEKIKLAKGNKDEIEKIQYELNQSIIQMEYEKLDALAKSGQIMGNDYLNTLERMRVLNINYKKNEIDEESKLAQERKQVRIDELRQVGDVIAQGFELSNQIYAAQEQRAKERYDTELKAAGDNVEAKILAERKYDAEMKKIRQKQAIADKAQALFSIGLNTAVAIMSYAGKSLLMVPLIVALGAAQAATILAKPVPQYAKGTRSHTGGAAIMGEEGAELVTEPDGSMWLTENKPAIYDLSKGASVLPADRTFEYLHKYSMTNDASVFVDMTRTNNHLSDMKHILKNKEERQYDLSGRLTEKKRGNTTIHYIR